MAKKQKTINHTFTCPDCGEHELEEVMVNVVQSTVIDTLVEEDGELFVDYSDRVSHDEGELNRYQCVSCGMVLKDENEDTVTTPEGLLEWLKNHK